MLHARVNEHETIVLGTEGEIFKLHRAAVKAHEIAFASEHRCELVMIPQFTPQ